MMGHSLAGLWLRGTCPCGLADKTARTVQIYQDNGITLACRCPDHGRQTARLDDPAAVIDASTPVRTVFRSLCFARDRNEHATETVRHADDPQDVAEGAGRRARSATS
jgi:hypothetical protein